MGVKRRRKDEDDEPVGKSRHREVEEDDEETDDEDEDEERPRARRKPVKPAKSRRSRDGDDDEDEDDLDGDEEEDEDAVPARTSSIQGGWKAARKVVKQNQSGFANEFRFGDEDALVKFPQDEPFASFGQHWIERQGKRSFLCLKGRDPKGCPLCKAGDKPRSVVAFNIYVLHEDGDLLDEPVVKALLCGPRLLDQVEAEHEGRYGPIDSHYWVLSRSGKKGSYQTSIKAVKERDLEEDWEITPKQAEKSVKDLKPYGASIFQIPARKELLDIAREINAGD